MPKIKIVEKSINGENNNYRMNEDNSIKINKKLQEFKHEIQTSSDKGSTQESHYTINKTAKILEKDDPLNFKIQNIYDKMQDRIQTIPEQLPEKYFLKRNSLLTDLADVPHLNTMRSVFIVILISIFVNAVTKDIVKQGRINLGLPQIVAGMHNFHMAVFIWISMFISTIVVYATFVIWATFRTNLRNDRRNFQINMWDRFWIVSLIFYCLGFFYVTISAIIANSLQIMLSKIIIAEMIRFFMKTYAFVRSNIPRVLNYKLQDEDKKILYPTFSQFTYFSFAPTLIYRDNYPRTTHIRWNYVASCFVQFFAAFVCLHLIQEYIVVYSFKDYDLKNIRFEDVQLLISGNGIPSMFYFVCWLFIICHASQNIAAELLRFGDRLFYKDWWNATSIEDIFAGWNVSVYDWFYTYIYKDMYEIILPKNERAAKLVQYCIMMMFHEFIYGFPYGFYNPVMFFIYIIGLPLISSLKYTNALFMNTLILYSITNGMGILRTSLMIEYYARIECPVENATLTNYFIPRTYNCKLD